ncbi:hypothetical protein WDU94_004234 [Cyamophila willieti]
MWYEIIPCAAIVTAAIYIPGTVTCKLMNEIFKGNAFGRDVMRADMRYYMKRDSQKNNGDIYKLVGLESIKD